MSKLRCHISISLDGFVAGPNQSEENPLGEGGERLHDWAVALAAWRESHAKQGGDVNESTRILEERAENVGASVMGRNMFGPIGGGPWGDELWTGWWGDDPPYHHPVFIVTHHPRDPVVMEGGTTFHFVTDGIESALEQAREAADGPEHVAAHYAGADVLTRLLDDPCALVDLAALLVMRLAPSGQRNDPVVEPLSTLAERVLLALIPAGDETVRRDRDVTPELAHRLCSGSQS